MRKAIWCAVGLLLVGWALMEPLAIRAQGSGVWNVFKKGPLFFFNLRGLKKAEKVLSSPPQPPQPV